MKYGLELNAEMPQHRCSLATPGPHRCRREKRRGAEAIKWYRKAAEQGNARAVQPRGKDDSGDAVPQDIAKP